MSCYFFSPLIGEDGKPVVRVPGKGDAFIMDGEIMTSDSDGEFEGKYPIFVAKKFEEDPFGEIRKFYEEYMNIPIHYGNVEETSEFVYKSWQAVTATMKRLEEGK